MNPQALIIFSFKLNFYMFKTKHKHDGFQFNDFLEVDLIPIDL